MVRTTSSEAHREITKKNFGMRRWISTCQEFRTLIMTIHNNTNQSPYQLALSEMRSNGFCVDQLIADGAFHRFSKDNDRDTDSFYICFENNLGPERPTFLHVTYGDWSDPDRKAWHEYKPCTSALNHHEKQLLDQQTQFAKQKTKELRVQEQLKVSSECQTRWQMLSRTGSSDYLKAKQLPESFGARFDGDNLVIPCLDEKGTIWSFQTIYPNGDKRFKKGGKKTGTFFTIGELLSADRFYIAEGFATGASIHLATKATVVIAFDCGNLLQVAELLRNKFPEKQIDICGDNDQWKKDKGNPGKEAAIKAAKAVGGNYFLPSFKSTETEPTDFNDLHCLEGLDEVHVQLSHAQSDQDQDSSAEPKRTTGRSQATELVKLASEVELFETPEGDAFATFVNHGHRETWPLTSKKFNEWLTQQYYRRNQRVCGSQATKEAIDTLCGIAKFDGAKKQVNLRIAREGDTIYLDLCNDNWEIIEIDKNGWRRSENSEIKFRRSGGMSALPFPIECNPKEGIEKLRQFINVESDADFQLIVAFLLGSLHPSGPYLILVVYGEQGTGKSTMVRVLRSLIDPNQAPLRKTTRTTDDLMVMAKQNFMIVCDNLSYLNDETSDDLCRLATGGGFTKRKLYSDDTEVTIKATRPIILNGIAEFVERGDLVSRSIVINLPVIEDKHRETEKAFNARFENAKSEILGSLLSAVSESLKNQHSLRLEENPRMADAWHWISSGVSAFGWKPEEIIKRFKEGHDGVSAGILEASPLYVTLMKLIEEPKVKMNKWRNTPTATLKKLEELLGENEKVPKGWPSNPKKLSEQLKRLAPQLRSAGIGVEFGRSKERFIEIWKSSKSIDASDATTQLPGKFVESVGCDDEMPY
jgi:phage/plasmid primase-like uncharacterized protein/energy-coupling factor transporter ATP-binding protein EcfA2